MTEAAVSFGPERVASFDDPADARAAPGTTWVRADDDDGEAFERIAETFDLHALSLEDVRNDSRPKLESFEDHTFVLLKRAHLASGETAFADELVTTPLGVFIGDGWLVTLSSGPIDAVDRIWAEVEAENRRTLARSADYTAYRVIDRLMDGYFTTLDDVETAIEATEDDVVNAADQDTLERINAVRRDLLSLRKILWPTREAIGPLARGDPAVVEPETEKYFRDVYDHCVQLVDLTETYRDLVSGTRDIYLNSVAQSTNEAMKTLTVVATIVLPLTFVAGIYGMNFDGGPYNMPELGWQFGYPAAMLGMAGIAAVMIVYFRQEGWL